MLSAELATSSESDRPTRLGVVLLAVLVSAVGLRFAVIQPVRNYLEDFRAYYAAGWGWQHGFNPYDIDAINAHLTLPGDQPVYFYPYPPPSLLVMYPFSRLPYPLAQLPWCLFAFALGTAALWVLCRAQDVAFGSQASVLLAFVFLMSSSVSELFRWGQFDMTVLILLALMVLSVRRGWLTAAGACVGLAALAKVTPCVYLGVFLLRRDWRALRGALVAIAGLMLLCYLLIGADGFRLWYGVLTYKFGKLEHTMSPENMSLHGYVFRALVNHSSFKGPSTPWLDLGPPAATLIAYALVALLGLVTIVWMIRQRRLLDTAECVAAAIPVVLLMSPITWTHHAVTLLVPLAFIVAAAARAAPGWPDLGWLAAIALLWTFSPVQQYQIELPSRAQHLFAPTLTYAVVLTWLFMICRYVPLKRAGQGACLALAGRPM